MATKTTPVKIESIEVINDTVMFIADELTAKKLLQRNARARVVKGNPDDDRFAVIYALADCNLLNGVKRA